MYRTVVTICTAQWSLYVQHSGHYMYRTVVTICTAQWSLYVPHSGHYMYSTVVTICTAQWSLYVPHSGHYMYRKVVTICTTSLTFNNSTFCPHSVFMCFVWISEQTAIISLYNINWLVFITVTQCVHCAVRTECLYKILFYPPLPVSAAPPHNPPITITHHKPVQQVPSVDHGKWNKSNRHHKTSRTGTQ